MTKGQTVYFTTLFDSNERAGVIQEVTSVGYLINGAWYSKKDITIKNVLLDSKLDATNKQLIHTSSRSSFLSPIDCVLLSDQNFRFDILSEKLFFSTMTSFLFSPVSILVDSQLLKKISLERLYQISYFSKNAVNSLSLDRVLGLRRHTTLNKVSSKKEIIHVSLYIEQDSS